LNTSAVTITKFVVIFLLLFCSATVNAQVSGFIVDQQQNRPVVGATVFTSDLENGTQTDRKGFFELNIDDFPVSLTITNIGYKTVELVVDSPETELRIELKRSIIESEGIMVSADRIQISDQESRPIAVNRIKPSDMAMTIRASAPEMLRSEPGVYVQQTTIGQGSVYVRGRSGRDVLYLFNNFRLNPGFTRSGQNQYFAVIDPFAVDEIQVYRGPVSVFYGSDALSGGIHVKPDTPTYSDTTSTSADILLQTNFRGTAERTASAKISHQQERFAFSLNGTWRDFQYYRMPGSSTDDRWFPYNRKLNLAEMNFGAFNATTRFRVNETSQFTAASYFSRIPDSPRLDRMMMGYDIEMEPAPTQPRSGYYSNTAPLAFSAHSITFTSAPGTPRISSIRIRAGIHQLQDDRVERDFSDEPYFSHNSAERDHSFTLSDEQHTDRNQSNQFLFSTDFITPVNEQIILSWGGDFTYEKIKSVARIDGEVHGLPRYPDGSEIISGGFFLHADYNISPRFLMETGVRYSVTHNRIPFEGRDSDRGFDPYSDTFTQVTGSAGARYSLTRHIDLTGNISSGFRAPNVADLAEIGIRRSDQFQSPNIDLIPEKSFSIDTGLHLRSGVISFESHVFWLHYFDKIERILTGNIVTRNGEFIRAGETVQSSQEFVEVISSNAGSMNLFGIEFGSRLSVGEQINAGATFTYNWGELTNPDGTKEPTDRIPPANGLIYLSFEYIPKLILRPQVRYNLSHRRLSPMEYGDNRISKNGTDGFVNVQLISVYEGISSLKLKLFADNLLDSSYREHASSLDGLSRNVTVSVSYSF
jgi:outer membrane receptor protein involved in Fe transport